MRSLAQWARDLTHYGDCAASDAAETGDTVETAWGAEVDRWSRAEQEVDDHTFNRLHDAFARGWARRIRA